MGETTDAAGPKGFADVAAWMLSMHDDLLDDHEDHPGDDMTEEEALEIIRREYVSGTCGAYAIALHDATGLGIVGMNGGMHVAVITDDGRIVDFMGAQPIDVVMARYGMRNAPMTSWTRQEAVDHVLVGLDDLEIEGGWDDLSLAAFVLARRGLPDGIVPRGEKGR